MLSKLNRRRAQFVRPQRQLDGIHQAPAPHFPRSRNDDICDGLAHAAQFIATQNIYSDEPLVAVLHQDRIDAARALAHPVTGYERWPAAQPSHDPSPAAAAASIRIVHGWARDGDLETVMWDSVREVSEE